MPNAPWTTAASSSRFASGRWPIWAPIFRCSDPTFRRRRARACGVYDFEAASVEVEGIFTNTVPVDAYRGAGRPEAAYMVERLVNEAARAMRMTPAAIRLRNFIAPE